MFVEMRWLHQSRESPRLVLVVVCVALLLDNMLLTVVGECTHTEHTVIIFILSHSCQSLCFYADDTQLYLSGILPILMGFSPF